MSDISNSNSKTMYLNYLRVFAMFSVILIHVFVTARTDFNNQLFSNRVVTEVFSQILHFGVPIFFMITGTLFLNKNKEISIEILYKKYIFKYIMGIVVFGWAFSAMEIFFSEGLSISILTKGFLNMIEGKSWEHMWYLYSLVGVLIFLPILKCIINNDKEDKLTNYILVILIITASLIPIFENLTNVRIGIVFTINSEYIAYMILGYKMSKEPRDNNKNYCIMMLFAVIILMVTNILFSFYHLEWMKIFGNYSSPIIGLLSLSIFKIFKNNIENGKNKKIDNAINKLSELSYGVYIVHMFWINIIYKFLKCSPYGNLFILKIILIFQYSQIDIFHHYPQNF